MLSNRSKILHYLLVILLFFLTSCLKQSVSTRKKIDTSSSDTNTTQNTSNTSTPTYPQNNDDSSSTGGDSGNTSSSETTRPAFSFEIIGHGTGNTLYPPNFIWSSASAPNLTGDQQGKFITDYNLKFRFKTLPNPDRGDTDSYNSICQFSNNYSKLKVKIGVKSNQNGTYYLHTSEMEADLNQYSEIANFNGTIYSGQFYLDIIRVYWDIDCSICNGNDDCESDRCPYYPVWYNDCFRIQLEMVTDHTNDF